MLADEFRETLPRKPEVTEATDDEATYLTVGWPDGSSARLALKGTNVHWENLDSKRKRLYSQLAKVTPPFFRERGFVTFTAKPVDAEARKVLLKRLNWKSHPDRRGYIVTEI